jgi:pseudouridine kinase
MTTAVDAHVVAVGGANLDVKARISGRTIAGTSNPGAVTVTAGGVARNIAHNLALLRVPVRLVSAVGRDVAGDRLLAETKAAGVDVRAILRTDAPTSMYSAVLDAQGELMVAVAAMAALDRLTPARLARHKRTIADARLVIADCNLPRVSLAWLIDLAAAQGKPLALEAVSAPKAERLQPILSQRRPVFALFCNRQELAALVRRPVNRPSGLAAAADVLHGWGVRHVCVNLGRAGVFASQRDGTRTARHRVPAVPARMIDVTGAGDAAVAGTIYGFLRGCDAIRSARYGQAAAALTVASDRTVSPRLSRRALEALVR